MDKFEEENMTRLVTTKREEKRRREDEAALSMGYGVGGTGRMGWRQSWRECLVIGAPRVCGRVLRKIWVKGRVY
jgi:U3 small nucleolar ribonucleoprotein protein LCP5